MEQNKAKPSGVHTDRRTNRMEGFSDALIAISITLLILEIEVPTGNHLAHELLSNWPIYLAYIVCFASIGAAWLNHTLMTEYLDHGDFILLRLNLLFLFFVSVLPFPLHLWAKNLDYDHPVRIAVTVFGVCLLAMNLMISVMWRYAASKHLIHSHVDDGEVKAMTAKTTPSTIFYGIALLTGILLPKTAMVFYLLIALFLLIPFKTLLAHTRDFKKVNAR
jgi:uncharacterized membrane protein